MDTHLIKMAIILGLLSLIGPFSIDMYLPALPIITQDLGTTETITQLSLTVYFLSFGVSQLFFGPASDTFGRKPPMYVGLAIFSLGSLACAIAPTIETLLAARFVQGVGAAGVMAIPRAIIRDEYTGTKATRLMSTVMLVIAISPMLAPLVGSLIMEPFGWRAVFSAILLTAMAAVALSVFALPETLPPEKRTAFDYGLMLQSYGTLVRDKNFMGLTLIGGLGMATFFTFLGSSSFVYMDFFGLNPQQFSLAFATGAIGFFAASQFAANAQAKFGAVNLIRGATFGNASALVLLLLVFMLNLGNLWILITMFLIANAFMGFIMPTAMVLSLEEHGPIAGAAASLGGTIQMLTGAAGMIIGGVVYNGTPIPMLAVMGGAAALAFFLSIVLVRNRAVQPAE